jgi:predicted amidohydrolase YtcJ
MQPQHASAEEIGRGGWVTAVGPERVKYAFPWNSLDQAGGKLAFGSDWPVVTLNPITGINTAVKERSPALPKQQLSIEKAIEAYTINGAYSSFEEKIKGSIKVGKLADMIILTDNLFSTERDIADVKVFMTIFGGKLVYSEKER